MSTFRLSNAHVYYPRYVMHLIQEGEERYRNELKDLQEDHHRMIDDQHQLLLAVERVVERIGLIPALKLGPQPQVPHYFQGDVISAGCTAYTPHTQGYGAPVGRLSPSEAFPLWQPNKVQTHAPQI
jgi:hypothetical protein